jgi:acetyl-CoA carboxylase biotin carboxylase subunit
MSHSISKILIANRGEIAERIIRTCRKMGILTVAVFSDADKNSRFVKKADEAFSIGSSSPSESYLNINKLIEAAKQTGADAIHPAYGFLSENEDFAAACKKANIIFIGPTAEVIKKMGSKKAAKELVRQLEIPTVPGYNGEQQDIETLAKEAKKTDFPVLIKAAMGGGGKGMRIVYQEKDLISSLEGARREAEKSFGDGTLILEKYFTSVRHVEVQIIGDHHGNQLHLYERECSIQRRHQKIIEESPSLVLNSNLRKQMTNAAIAIAKALNYTNVGTVEFIVDEQLNYYFLEVNTRLQVEHPVTEMVTGLDLVELQIRIAEGHALPFKQEDVKFNGHAIECRIYAENPENNFLPCTGYLLNWNEQCIEGLRYDSGIETGNKIDVFYDPMLAKIISWASTRKECIRKMKSALQHLHPLCLTTNKDFLFDILSHPEFEKGSFDTQFIEHHFKKYKKELSKNDLHHIVIAAFIADYKRRNSQTSLLGHIPTGWRNNFYQPQFSTFFDKENTFELRYKSKSENNFKIEIENQKYKLEILEYENDSCKLLINEKMHNFVVKQMQDTFYISHIHFGIFELQKKARFVDPADVEIKGTYKAPMPGEIIKLNIKPGDSIKAGQTLMILSSMKMENTIEAFEDGIVEEIYVSEKGFVEADTVLLKMN